MNVAGASAVNSAATQVGLAVEVTSKAQDQMKQEGKAAVDLIRGASQVASGDGGHKVNKLA